MKIIPSQMCSCGEAEQGTSHILQTCKNHQALREEIWPLPTILHEKLYGPVDSLKKTTRFVGYDFHDSVQMLVESVVSCPQSKDGSLVRPCQLVVTVLLLRSLE
jgi:hypothetical protein